MKKIIFLLLILLPPTKSDRQQKVSAKPPAYMTGSFEDDYQEHYKINDTLWIQLPNTRFHIIKWDTEKQYIIARNDNHNPGDRGLYTRPGVTYSQISDIPPNQVCLVWDAARRSTLIQDFAPIAADYLPVGSRT